MNNYFPKGRATGLVVQELPDELLVYDLETNRATCLNKGAASVWMQCTGELNADGIAAAVASETGASVNEDYVLLALDSLQKAGLLEGANDYRIDRVSRRKALKGLAAITIALPVAATLAAPHSVHAQSGGTCAQVAGAPVSCTVGVTDCNADEGAGGVCAPGCSCSGAVCIPNGGTPCCTSATNVSCA